MRKKVVIILVVVFAGGILLRVFIPRLLERRGLLPSPTHFISRYLSLTESQKKKMESLDQLFRAKLEETRAQLDEKRAELSDMLGASSPDQKKIKDKVSEIASLQAELQRETINHLEEIRSILTPEQEAKFFSLVRKRLHPGRPWMKFRRGKF